MLADHSERALQVFQKFDVDGDGFISREDFTGVLREIGLPEGDVDGMYDMMDLDRDGKLNYSEFLAWTFSDEAPEAIRSSSAAADVGSIDEEKGVLDIASAAARREDGSSGRDDVVRAAVWEEDLSLWPLGKLLANLRDMPTRSKKGNAVLVTTGAMNPVHRGHVQQLHQARARLEAAGYRVLAAWLSPSHDGYVQPKCLSLKTLGLSAPFRLKLARCAVEEDDFVSVGAWEASKEGAWPDFPVVVKALQSELRRHRSCRDVQLFYVCGDDHFRKCGLHIGMRSSPGVGIVAVPRGGTGGREKPDKSIFVARSADGEVAGYSSTKVRAALQRSDIDYVRQAISPGAARFLLQPSREEYAEFTADYRKIGVPAP